MQIVTLKVQIATSFVLTVSPKERIIKRMGQTASPKVHHSDGLDPTLLLIIHCVIVRVPDGEGKNEHRPSSAEGIR